jgi:sulfate permease, SulP family
VTETAERPLIRYVPALAWSRHYQRRWLGPDVIAGLTAGAVVIPQAMAYATIAGMPVEVGLYSCLLPMLMYVLLGGSRALSVSSTSTIATLTASTLVAADVAKGSVRDLSTLVFLVGVVLLVARLLRLASLVQNISDSLLVGIKIGVGLTVAVGQLPKLLGVDGYPGRGHFFPQLWYVLRHLPDCSVVTVAFSVASIASLIALRRLAPRAPAPLVVVVGGILLIAFGHLDQHGLRPITEVPSGLPTPEWPAFDHIGPLVPGAIAIALMAFLETVSAARNVRRADEPLIDNDQELFADGLATLGPNSIPQNAPPSAPPAAMFDNCFVRGFFLSGGHDTTAPSSTWISCCDCSCSSVASASSAPVADSNFHTVSVAIVISFRSYEAGLPGELVDLLLDLLLIRLQLFLGHLRRAL